MTAITRLCQYPVTGPGFRTSLTSQNSIKQYIRDFDMLMLDAGLLKSTLANQLDTLNIPTLDVSPCFTSNAQRWNFDNNQAVYYAPLEYVFDDTGAPFTIRFEFFYYRPNARATTANLANEIPFFGCKVSIINSAYTQVLWQIPYSARSSSPESSLTQVFDSYTLLYPMRKSMICYDKNLGYLYLNLCPDTRISLNFSQTGNNPTLSGIHLLISRSKNGNNQITGDFLRVIAQKDRITDLGATIVSSYPTTTSTLTSGILPTSAFYSYTVPFSPSAAIYQSDTQFQVPFDSTLFYKNGEFVMQMSTIYDPVNQIPVYDQFVLIGNRAISTGQTGSVISINVNDTEVKNYLIISQTDTGGFIFNANQVLLVYFN